MTSEKENEGFAVGLPLPLPLPTHDVDARRADLIRTRACRILARRRGPTRELRSRAEALYRRVLEPALVAGLVVLDLTWALVRIEAILR